MTNVFHRARQLVYRSPRHPVETWDRVAAGVERRLDAFREPLSYTPTPWNQVLNDLNRFLGVDVGATLDEAPIRNLEANLPRQIAQLRSINAQVEATADLRLAQLCYVSCRALQPRAVVETGVLHGLTTSFILAALGENRDGTLHSVDFPPLASTPDAVGTLVPDGLRSRWHLHLGTSRRLLRRVLPTLPALGLFVHDSLHTYRTTLFELRTVEQHLASRSVVLVDDILGHQAFSVFSSSPHVTYRAVIEEESKPSAFGICVLSRG